MKKTNFHLSRDELKYIRNITFLSLIINFIIEVLNTDSLIATLSSMIHKPHIFLYNALIILVTLSVTLLLRHRFVICSLITITWLGFGITNNILLNFRTTPFTAVDLSLVTEAIPIMDKYLTHLQIVGIIVAIVAIIVALVFAFIKLPKHKGLTNYISNSVAIVVILFFTLGLTSVGMRTNVLAKNFGNIGDAFKNYGFAYCFANSLINTGIDKPSNYSEETIQTIVEAAEDPLLTTQPTDESIVPEEPADEQEAKTPNIIFLQLESFFDPTHVKGITFSSDPIPNYHSLQENYTSGFLNVPSVGAGTANTEFEIITGMDLDFFGPGEYPYKTILKETTCESMAYNLKELGYSTHAIHNNTATFYGRNKVFSNLGFDTFTSEEYMENITYNPLGWANDDVLVEEIMNALNSTSGNDYIYTISVQGHGKYPKDAESLYNGVVSEGLDGDFKDETSADVKEDATDDVKEDATDDLENSSGKSSKENGKDKAAETKESANSDDTTSDSTDKNTTTNASNTEDTTVQQASSIDAYSIDHEIKIDGIDEDRSFAFEYYVNQIHEMDQFIGNLISTLEASGEDVILVMYGDHLPSLGIEEEDLDNGNIYQTEYIIWSSEGVIDGQHDRDLEAYQLSAYTLSLIHQNSGLLTKLHQQELANEFEDNTVATNDETTADKATTDKGVADKTTTDKASTDKTTADKTSTDKTSDNSENASQASTSQTNANQSNSSQATTFENGSTPEIPYLDELELLQYDMLYGKQECYNNVNPYIATTLQMGVIPITIESVDQNDGLVTVHGSHFTAASKVEVNGKLVETTMIDHTTLTFQSDELPSGTSIYVAQVNGDDVELSRTDEYLVK